MSGLKAKGRSAVAVALVALFVFVPSPARADDGGVWWLPDSWVSVLEGAWTIAQKLLGGAEVEVTGGAEPFESGPGEPIPSYGATVWRPELAGVDERGLPLIRYNKVGCFAGSLGSQGCHDVMSGTISWVPLTYSDGYVQQVVELTRISEVPGVSAVYEVKSYVAEGHGPVVRAEYLGTTSGTGRILEPFVWVASAELAVTTTTLVCRDLASGQDFIVSETSAPGSTVAPRPVCPAGSAPVRVTITNSVDGVLSDVSITAPDWYLADPSGVEFGFTVDGTICQAGNPECDDLVANPHHWDPYTNKCYGRQRNLDLLTSLNVSYPAAIPGPGDGWIEVPEEFCLDRPESDLPISEPPETPDDQDLGVISRAIERVIEAVKAVGSAVRAGAERVAQGIAGFRSDMNEKISGLRQDMKDGFDRVVEAIGGIGDSGDGDGDGDGEGSLPGDTGDLLGRAGDALGEPFKEWTDALAAIPAAFTVPASDCMGPAWTIPGGGTHYPFQTCTGEAAKVARIVYVMTGAAVSLVGLLAVVRLLGAAIGVQVNSGASQE